MRNPYFRFRQFTVQQDRCAMKVSTDACLFGAWAAALSTGKERYLLDIGSGTGLLTLMLMQRLPNAKAVAVELDADAQGQAMENFEASPWRGNIETVRADILQFAESVPFDWIVCNPPFHRQSLKSPRHKTNLAKHEQGLTLDLLIGKMKRLLSENGKAALLLHFNAKQHARELLEEYGLYLWHEAVLRHSKDHRAKRWMAIFGKKAVQKITSEDLETDGECFKQLVADYYL